MSKRRSARIVSMDNACGQILASDSAEPIPEPGPTDETTAVGSGTTLISAMTSSKTNLLEESIQTLDIDWELPGKEQRHPDKTCKLERKSSRLESLAQVASGASGALSSTVSILGKRSRDAFENGKGRLQHGLKNSSKPARQNSKISRLSKELTEFLPDPEPTPAHLEPVNKPRPRLPKGWSYVVPDLDQEPPTKKTKFTDTIQAVSESTGRLKPVNGSKHTSKEKVKHGKDKKWESKGLYAGQKRGFDPRLTESQNKTRRDAKGRDQENAIMPFPLFKGEDLLTTNQYHRNFLLPFDVFQPLDPREEKPQKGDWHKLKSNRFIGDAAEEWKHLRLDRSLCNCGRDGVCGDDCWNRTMSYECDDDNCSVGSPWCGNRAFAILQRRSKGNRYDVGVDVVKTSDKGYGVQSLRTFEEDQIIVEYAGEIITKDECERRMLNEYKDAECYYLMEFNQSMVIDATKGSIARFVNHSCEPNCKMEQWAVAGKPRMALFAKRQIMTGEELTYDYNFAPFSKKNIQVCHCGSKQCRGVIGPRGSKDKERQIQPRSEKRSNAGILAGTRRKFAALFERHLPTTDDGTEDASRRSSSDLSENVPLPTLNSSRRLKPATESSTSRTISASTGNTTLVDVLADVPNSTMLKDASPTDSALTEDVVIRNDAKSVQKSKSLKVRASKKHNKWSSKIKVLDRAREGLTHRRSKLKRRNRIDGKSSHTVGPIVHHDDAHATSSQSTLKRKLRSEVLSGSGPHQFPHGVPSIYDSDSSVDRPVRAISADQVRAQKTIRTSHPNRSAPVKKLTRAPKKTSYDTENLENASPAMDAVPRASDDEALEPANCMESHETQIPNQFASNPAEIFQNRSDFGPDNGKLAAVVDAGHTSRNDEDAPLSKGKDGSSYSDRKGLQEGQNFLQGKHSTIVADRVGSGASKSRGSSSDAFTRNDNGKEANAHRLYAEEKRNGDIKRYFQIVSQSRRAQS